MRSTANDWPRQSHLRRLARGTQSPGARSYCQKAQPLQVRRPHANAAASDGEVNCLPPDVMIPFCRTRAVTVLPLNRARNFVGLLTYLARMGFRPSGLLPKKCASLNWRVSDKRSRFC